MSFTQEKRTNITSDQAPVRFSPVSYCDGCDARCELGYEYGHGLNYYIYPTIGGRPMFSYIDKDCIFQPTSVFVKEPRTPVKYISKNYVPNYWLAKLPVSATITRHDKHTQKHRPIGRCSLMY